MSAEEREYTSASIALSQKVRENAVNSAATKPPKKPIQSPPWIWWSETWVAVSWPPRATSARRQKWNSSATTRKENIAATLEARAESQFTRVAISGKNGKQGEDPSDQHIERGARGVRDPENVRSGDELTAVPERGGDGHRLGVDDLGDQEDQRGTDPREAVRRPGGQQPSERVSLRTAHRETTNRPKCSTLFPPATGFAVIL